MSVGIVGTACIEGVLAIAAEPAVFCFFVIVDDEVFVPAVMDLVVFWGNDEVIFFVNDGKQRLYNFKSLF